MYTGRNLEDSTSVGLCSQVVLDLMSGLEKKGHELYTDNYTSLQLYQSLYDKGINACGSVRIGNTFQKNLCINESNTNVASLTIGLMPLTCSSKDG